MQSKPRHMILLLSAAALLCSCASRKVYSTNYYFENEKTLTTIEQSFKTMYAKKHFSVGFTDLSFNYISLEIMTDSLKYIYEFEVKEPRFQDTLLKYGLNAEGITELVMQMRAIHCLWINNLDVYSNNQKRSLVFMSIKPVAIHLPFTSKKYYILTFYSQPQYFDSEGRLLASRQRRKLQRINDDIFRRINDKVAYTVSERFR
jgi:hypothetical protein